MKLKVFVKNVGDADSAETLVFLKNLSHDALYLKKGRARLDSVPKGELVEVDFEFDVKSAPKEGEKIELEVDIYDTTYREYTEKKFQLPFGAKETHVATTTGGARVANTAVKLFVSADVTADIAAVAGKGGGKGTRTVNINRRGPLVWPTRAKVVRFEPVRDYAFRIKDNASTWSFELEPTATGTRVVHRREAPNGTTKVSRVLQEKVLGGIAEFDRELTQGMAVTLQRLKALLESD